MSNYFDLDKLNREKVTTDFKTNFFVEAGAGSGKTTLLVDRMVAMIASGINMEHICAITFTKAAANEFYDRFYKKLKQKIAEEEDEVIKERYQIGLKNIDLAFMGTIDSFCNMIINEHPSINEVPSGTRVVDDEELDTIYNQYYDILMQSDNLEASEFQEAAGYKARSIFVSGLKLFNTHRNYQIVFPNNNHFDIDKDVICSEFKKNIQTIVRFILKNPGYADTSSKIGQTGLDSLKANANTLLAKDWMSDLPNVLKALKELEKIRINEAVLNVDDYEVVDILNDRSYFKKPSRKVIAPLFEGNDDTNSIFEEVIKKINNSLGNKISSFILNSMNEINEKMRKQGLLTFFDFLYYLAETLQKDANNDGTLIKHIYERHKYFMIDEFQDTDPIQSKVFLYLAGKEIKPNHLDCIPHPGSLFIVGDPKQSIYRFKNADVTSYHLIQEYFNNTEGCEVLKLTKNFRSNKTLCNYFNDRFSEILAVDDDPEQSKFEMIPVNEKAEDQHFRGVYSYCLPKDPGRGSEEEKIDYDPLYVCKIIKDLVNSDKKIAYYDSKEKKIKCRKIQYSDFMLITSGKTKIANYTAEMTRKQIPFYVEGQIKFNESETLRNLINLYLSITNSSNRYAYQVAKSSLYGLSDDQFKNKDYEGIIEELRKDVNSLSPSTLFERLIETTDAIRCSNSRNLEYVYFVLELLRNKENDAKIYTHNNAGEYLLKLLSNNELERCPSLQEEVNMVHIANLHKVKGLQKPIVILANSGNPRNSPEFRSDLKDNKFYVFEINKVNFSANEDQKELEKESLNKEHLRLEYVAATRAGEVLIIGQKLKKDGVSKNYWSELVDDEILAKNIGNEIGGFDSLLNSEKESAETGKKDKAETKNVVKIKDNEVREIKKEIKFNLHHPSEDFTEFSKTSNHINAKLTGTLIHRMMELLTLSKENVEKAKLIELILNEENVVEKRYYFKNVLEKAFDKITTTGYKQENGVEENILETLKKADEVYCEYPFSYLDNDELWVGTIDALYREGEQWYVIDYKTDSDGSNLDARHSAQLEAYKKALNEYLKPKKEIIAHTYHIEIE